MSSNIIRYDDMLYSSRPVSISEFLSDQNNKIHEELFQDALSKLLTEKLKIDDIEKFKRNHKIIEDKSSEYWQPSSVTIISKSKKEKFKKETYDLSEYWNYYQEFADKDVTEIAASDEKITDAEIIYIDYVKGKAKMRRKNSGEEFEVPFNYLNAYSMVSDDYSLSDTFTNKYSSIE